MDGCSANLAISEVAERTGLSTHTLRYYERLGLVEPVARTGSGHRRYSPADLDWLEFVLRLRETSMPIAEMRRYAQLRRRGPETAQERLELLVAHRARVSQNIAALQATAAVLDDKIALYRDTTASPQGPDTEEHR